MESKNESAERSGPPAPSNFPLYPKPQGIPNFGEKFSGPLTKMITARAHRSSHGKGSKGIVRSDKVHITRRKTKWY